MLKRIAILLPVALMLYTAQFFQGDAKAVSGSDWNPGRIVDDVVFQNKDAMSVQQIQQFLDSKVPNCDRNGTTMIWDSAYGDNVSRATYSARRGVSTPFTCLKEYVENPTTKENNVGRPTAVIPGGLSAAQLIYNAAQAQNINPQVYLVLLQKEQSLVTDNWPWPKQFERATGNNCPDTAPCNPQFAWLWTQVNNSGVQFNRYVNNFDDYNYAPGWNNILYSPNTSCGTRSIFIENRFTAALYIYTPYTPNQAALDNMYGTGDSCSSYGNRNFWRLFNDWFGSSLVANGAIQTSDSIKILGSYYVGNEITFTYQVKNLGSYNADTGVLWVCGTYNGTPFGGGSTRATLGPNQTLNISFKRTFDAPGNLFITACGDIPNGPGWTPGYPYTLHPYVITAGTQIQQSPITITSPPQSSIPSPRVGETTTLSYTVRNNGTNPADSGVLWICAGLNNNWFGSGASRKVLAPGETLTMSMPYTPSTDGKLEIVACGNTPNGPGWVSGYPTGTPRTSTVTVQKSAVSIVGAIQVNNPTLQSGQETTISYAVRNNGTNPADSGVLWICAGLNNNWFGSGAVRKILAPGEVLVVSKPYTPVSSGKLEIVACGNTPNGPGWVPGYPAGDYIDWYQKTLVVN